MLTIKLDDLGKYDYLKAEFKQAFDFLQNENLESLAEGVYSLKQGVSVQVQCYQTKKEQDCFFETHDQHFDIQYIISGREKFGYAKRDGLILHQSYDKSDDITLYQRPQNGSYIILESGDFIVVSPEEGHMPRVAVDETAVDMVSKIVIKVPVKRSDIK